MHILLVTPISSAQVKQQFSTVIRILKDWRLSLGLGTIESLLRISSKGSELTDFNPLPAVQKWWQNCTRSRRPHTKPRHTGTDHGFDSMLQTDSEESDTDVASGTDTDCPTDVHDGPDHCDL